MSYRNYSTAKGLIVDPSGNGDFTTISDAVAVAPANSTVFIRKGTYSEVVVITNPLELRCYEYIENPNSVEIDGTIVFAHSSGTVTLDGLYLTNSSNGLLVNVFNGNTINISLKNCYLNSVTGSGLDITGGTIVLNIENCRGDLGNSGHRFFSFVNITANITNSYFTNSGASAIHSVIDAVCNLTVKNSTLNFNIESLSSNSFVRGYNSEIGFSNSDTSLTITGASGASYLQNCLFTSSPGASLSIAAGATVTVADCIFDSASTDVITGSGVLLYSGMVFTGTSSVVSVVTATQLPNGLPLAITNGGTGVTSVTTAPTPNSWAGWDANLTMQAARFEPFQTPLTADGSTYAFDSTTNQEIFVTTIGESADIIIVLPDETTVPVGTQFYVINSSAFAVNITAFDSSGVVSMNRESRSLITLTDLGGTLLWNPWYSQDNGAINILITNPGTSSLPETLTLGTAYQNTHGYDVMMVVYLNITVNAGGNVKCGVGPTNTPGQQTLLTGLTALGFFPVSFYLPAGYYALITATVTATITGQQSFAI